MCHSKERMRLVCHSEERMRRRILAVGERFFANAQNDIEYCW